METNAFRDVSDRAGNDGKGWSLAPRRRPRKQNQVQLPPLSHRKIQGRKKSPHHLNKKKKSKNIKWHKILLVDLLEQEPLVFIIVKELFPIGVFKKVSQDDLIFKARRRGK